MFERLNTPQELFHYQLGAALKMENTVLEMLGNLEEESQNEQLKQQFRHHAEETEQQIRNIEQAFSAMGEEPDTARAPPSTASRKRARQTSRRRTTASWTRSFFPAPPRPSTTRSPSMRA